MWNDTEVKEGKKKNMRLDIVTCRLTGGGGRGGMGPSAPARFGLDVFRQFRI